jgi:HPt (histidine-containing phosphotransfer) domain-containing protein
VSDGPRPVFDRARFDAQTGGDRDLQREVVQMFLEDCDARVQAIRAAIGDRDATRLRSTAHALKGTAVYLSAPAVVETATRLEGMGRDETLDDAAAGLERLEAAVAELIAELHRYPEG